MFLKKKVNGNETTTICNENMWCINYLLPLSATGTIFDVIDLRAGPTTGPIAEKAPPKNN